MIYVVDSIMGSGKTTWAKLELLERQTNRNFLYVTPYIDDVEKMTDKNDGSLKREMYQPKPRGKSKLDNIVELLNGEFDIASTHELFRRFDERCKNALQEHKYTLVLDEALTAVEPYHFQGKEDFEYLLSKGDVVIDEDGVIRWVGSELDTRFDDVRILAKNQCLFRIDEKFYLWHFPHEIFSLFENVYILTYLFEGSLLKYYFDLYGISYEKRSIQSINGKYELTDYFIPDKAAYQHRLNIYEGVLNTNIGTKNNVLSATWCNDSRNKPKLNQLKNNLRNFALIQNKAASNDVMWTCFKSTKKSLKQKGYTNGFISCNCRGTNDYQDRTVLMYCCNWYENPEITKFFAKRGITIDQEQMALSTLIQWIWRSNIRVNGSTSAINVYVPSTRMRNLLKQWLSA